MTLARVTTIRHAVRVASGKAAAVEKRTVSGIDNTFAAGTTTKSASVPARCSPRIAYRRHSGLSPVRQYSHVRSLTPGFTTTRSPTRIDVTDDPTWSTTPAQSAPRIHPG